MKEKLS